MAVSAALGTAGRALLFTTGSPFARAVRIVLHELGLDYEPLEELTTPTAASRAAATPTLQVPTLRDGDLVLWESGLIAEYLLATYSDRAGDGDPPLAPSAFAAGSPWRDRLVLATVQTLGTAATTVSQLTWTGVGVEDNAHLARSGERIAHCLRWLEAQIATAGEGFSPGVLSIADIFLACHLRFVEKRPIGLDWQPDRHPNIAALLEGLDTRESFRAAPIRWWDPEVTGYAEAGTPRYD